MKKKFLIIDIENKLLKLNIKYKINKNTDDNYYEFKSIKKIEPNGIYYYSKDLKIPDEIENSIIFHSNTLNENNKNIVIQVKNPQLVFYQLMNEFILSNKKTGIHPTAIIGEGCLIDPNAYIGPYCVLEDCMVKSGAILHSHVTIMQGTTIEENVRIESHSTIGATGVAWIWNPETGERVIQPQIGYTTIERDTFLGSDVTVVRGSVNETTKIGYGCVIAHGSKIGHGSQVGPECHFANNVSIAGNVTLGKQCFLGSAAVVRPQTRLADKTLVGAGSVVVKDVVEPGLLLMGNPAKPTQPESSKLSGIPQPLS